MPNSDRYDNLTDENLVEEILRDPEAFAYLIRRYEDKLLRYIHRLSSVSKEDAEDILQEIFIKVYKNLNGFQNNMKFSSWIYRITHNEVISTFRKTKNKLQVDIDDLNDKILENLQEDFKLEEGFDNKILGKTLRKAMKKMKPRYREVLVLKFFEEKSYKEISEIIQKPMGTVATYINRAKKQFQKILEEENIKL